MRTTCWLYTIFLSFALYSIGWADSLAPAPPQNLRLLSDNSNQAPMAADDAYSTWQATPLRVPAPGVLANDNDPDGDRLTAILVAAPNNGSLSLSSDGSFTYTPNAGFTGCDSFTYTANDGMVHHSNIATVSIVVVTPEEGLAAHWALDETSGTLAADATTFGNHLVLGPVGSEPTWGTGLRAAALIFDGVNDRAQATNVPVDQTAGGKNTIAFWMKWNGQQGPMPVSMGPFDLSTGPFNLWISSMRFGFNTGTGDHLAISGFTAAEYGNRWIHVAAVFANPATTQEGWQTAWTAESKLYIDGVEQTLTQYGSPAARIASPAVTLGAFSRGDYNFGGALDDVRIYSRELTIQDVANLANPRAFDNTYLRNASLPLDVAAAAGVLANDTGVAGRALTALLVTAPEHGTVSLNTDGSFVYTPDTDWYWTDSFRYRVHDGTSYSNTATVTITTNVPVVRDIDSYNTQLNTHVTYGAAGGVLHNATDADDDPLTAVLESDVSHGSLTLNSDGSFTYTPDGGFTGVDSFSYKAYDGTYYSQVATVTITTNETLKPIPELALWEANMLSAGTLHGGRIMDGTYDSGAYFYDGFRVFHNIAVYTGDDSWLEYANRVSDMWIDGYVLPNNGAIAAWENVTHGLLERYFLGDTRSRDMLILISFNAAFAPDNNTEVLDYIYSREMAHVLNSYINAERLGEPRRVRLNSLFESVLGHIDQWIATKDNPYDDNLWSPFMIGLSSETLIYYWDYIEQDPRILEKLQLIADAMWEVAWQEEHQAFTYRMGESAPGSGAPNLNQMVSPLYSWLYLQTGDATYRDRGDKIFAGGARGAAVSWDAKTFNQSYRWSFDYLKWRRQAEEKLTAARTEEGEK